MGRSQAKHDQRDEGLGDAQKPDPWEASWGGLVGGMDAESGIHLVN